MLIDFIIANHEELIARTQAKVLKRLAPMPTAEELKSGVPLFLDQLAEMLRGPLPSMTKTMDSSAAEHGAALLNRGYSISQVVHDYGDVCQAVTELAAELDAPISTADFHILNLCLDNAIAGAVTEYGRRREQTLAKGETERLGVFAHELRNRISAAHLAFQAIKSGRAPVGGSVAATVELNLERTILLINRALVEVRMDTGITQRERIHLHQVIEQAEVEGILEANAHGVSFSVTPVDRRLAVEADPQILAGSVANLLQNAFKFTRAGGRVSLRTSVIGDRVEIEIEDECGGLPPDRAEELFQAFQQAHTNRSGLGLGLSVARKGVEASGGVVRFRDVPGKGCVFTIELPRFIADIARTVPC